MKFTKIGSSVGLILFVILIGYSIFTIHGTYDGTCDKQTPNIFDLSISSIDSQKYDCSFFEYTWKEILKPNAASFGIPIFTFAIILLGAPALVGLGFDTFRSRNDE